MTYGVILLSVAAASHALSNSGVIHCMVVGSVGLWMVVGATRNLKKKKTDASVVASQWDRVAAVLLTVGVVSGILTWISWYLGAQWVIIYVFWGIFLASFLGVLVVLAGYAIAKSVDRADRNMPDRQADSPQRRDPHV